MKSSHRAKLALIALLALSLLLKVVADESSPEPSPTAVAIAFEQMLERKGFAATILRLQRSPGIIVTASKRGCRLIGGDYLPHGTFAAVYADLARPLGTMSFAYRGTVYPRVPKARSLFDFYVWRELHRIGIRRGRPAVLALASSPACDLQGLPWSEVATIEG